MAASPNCLTISAGDDVLPDASASIGDDGPLPESSLQLGTPTIASTTNPIVHRPDIDNHLSLQ